MTTTTKEKVQSTTSTAADEAASVAGTAKTEAASVASEAATQVKNLASEAATQASDKASEHAHTQRDHLAEFVRTLGQDLDKMASGQEAPGMASDWIRKASTHLTDFGETIAAKDPAELLTDVQAFARRKPGLFLAVAAGAGLVAGRLVSGARHDSSHSPDTTVAVPATTGLPTTPPVGTGLPTTNPPRPVSTPGYPTVETPTYGDTDFDGASQTTTLEPGLGDRNGRSGF